jgi:hypothetical protein
MCVSVMFNKMGFVKRRRGGASIIERESYLKCGVKRYVLRVEGMGLGGSGGLEGKMVVLEIYNGTRLQILPESIL